MKNEYEIIGKVVEDILTSEMSEFLDQIMLSHRLKEEYRRISAAGAPAELKQLYESAIEIVGIHSHAQLKHSLPSVDA